MLVLPVIAVFLWIFIVGLVRDWKADDLDESDHRWLSVRTLFPWIGTAADPAAAGAVTGTFDPYPADEPAPEPAPLAVVEPAATPDAATPTTTTTTTTMAPTAATPAAATPATADAAA